LPDWLGLIINSFLHLLPVVVVLVQA